MIKIIALNRFPLLFLSILVLVALHGNLNASDPLQKKPSSTSAESSPSSVAYSSTGQLVAITKAGSTGSRGINVFAVDGSGVLHETVEPQETSAAAKPSSMAPAVALTIASKPTSADKTGKTKHEILFITAQNALNQLKEEGEKKGKMASTLAYVDFYEKLADPNYEIFMNASKKALVARNLLDEKGNIPQATQEAFKFFGAVK